MRRLCVFSLLLLLAGGFFGRTLRVSAAGQATDVQQAFPAGVDLVVVDVVVLDEDGNALAGLTRDDFTVKEDGTPQTVQSFEAIEVQEAPPPPPEPAAPLPPRVSRRISSNTEPRPRTGRQFAIVFDELHLSPDYAEYAKTAVAEFLREGVQPGDLVSLISTGSGVWRSVQIPEGRDELLSALETLEGRYLPPQTLREQMTDYEAMRIHVFEDRQVAARVERRFASQQLTDPDELEERLNPDFYEMDQQFVQTIDPFIKMRAADIYRMATDRTRRALDTVKRAIEAQSLEKGRKSLIFVSQGFIYDTELGEIKEVRTAARRANVAFYFVDARGLLGLPEVFSAERRWIGDVRSSFTDLQDVGATIFQMAQEAAGSEMVAAETGGFTIKNTNDLTSGLRRIGEESRNYYLLGYTSTNTSRNGKFRKIEVEVRGEDLKVRARKGYYAPEGSESRRAWTPDEDVQRALDAAYELPDIPLRMTAYVLEPAADQKDKVLVATDVDIRALALAREDGRFVGTLEYLLAVVDRKTNEYFRYDEKADMRLSPETREALTRTWYPIVKDFELPPGSYRAKIVARDRRTGQVGTVTHEFEVPSPGEWRVSTPILSTALDRGEDGKGRPRAVPSARRTYTPGEAVYCEFQVYGATPDPSTGLPRVASGHSLKNGKGATLFVAEPTPIRPSSEGMVSRLIGLNTQGLPPGDYALTLFFQDLVSGEMIEMLEPFRLSSPETKTARGGR